VIKSVFVALAITNWSDPHYGIAPFNFGKDFKCAFWPAERAIEINEKTEVINVPLSAFFEKHILIFGATNEIERLIPFTPVLHDVEFSALQGARVPVLFCSCQPVGKPIDRCPVKRSTRAFTTRTRVRSIWRTGAGRRASSAPLAAPAKAGP
jgi:hypothetical protein